MQSDLGCMHKVGLRTVGIRQGLKFVALSAVCALVFLISALPAFAVETSNIFTPKGEFSVDTDQAGAHPTLKLRMSKTANHCPGFVVKNTCKKIIWNDGSQIKWIDLDPYIEQDLKKWVIDLPEGLMGDPQATPKCDNPQPDPNNNFQYWCPPESQVGVIEAKTRDCQPKPSYFCLNKDNLKIGGAIYNGTPEPGEQGHLYTFVGLGVNQGGYAHWVRIDSSIRVTQPGFRVEAVTDQIPDFMEIPGGPGQDPTLVGIQPYDITMTLWGNNGSEIGHPLLSNATFCEPRNLESLFQGYENFEYADPNNPATIYTGTGTGNTVTSSLPYPVSGCDKVPYDPKFAIALSSSKVGDAPTIDTAISQQDGEQTTSSISVRFPDSFKINLKSKLAPCAAELMATEACSSEALLGSGEARSKLLPTDSLSGKVVLGKVEGTSFPMRISLKGFVDLAIDGKVGIDPNGQVTATFSKLPPVPISSFKMHLDGGRARGMLLNPDRCGDIKVLAEFKSHQGTRVERTVPLHISCGRALLKASMSTKKPRSHPIVTLRAKATGIDRLAFSLPNKLKLKKPSKLRKRGSYGSLDLGLTKRSVKAKLVLRSRNRRQATFVAKAGGKSVAALTLKKRKLSFTKLPPDLVDATLELNGKQGRFLTNPSRCRKRLTFSMQATDPEGKRQRSLRVVKVRCAKKHGSHVRKKSRRITKGR